MSDWIKKKSCRHIYKKFYIDRLNIKGWEKIHPENTNQTLMAILVLGKRKRKKVDFKTRNIPGMKGDIT